MTDNIKTPEQDQLGQWWEQERPPVLYAYSPVTGEYIGTCVADPSPLEPGVWLYPACTTDVEPPQTGDREAAIWTGEAWQVVPDWRGHIYFTQDGERHEITELGIAPPDDALDEPPPIPPTPEQIMAECVDRTQKRLDDFARTRNYDNILSACTYVTSTVPKFKAEGQYCVGARDATWAKLYEILAEVQAGTRPMPSGYEDIEPLLPVLEWPA